MNVLIGWLNAWLRMWGTAVSFDGKLVASVKHVASAAVDVGDGVMTWDSLSDASVIAQSYWVCFLCSSSPPIWSYFCVSIGGHGSLW